MALAIDASSPSGVTTASASTTTTGSFTPPVGSLILVAMTAGTSGVTPAAPTVTDNLGSHLTYTRTDWESVIDSGKNGQAVFWWAVGTGAAMTITGTDASTANLGVSVKVWVFTGADTVTPIGAHGKNHQTTGTVAQSFTAAGTGGWVFGALIDDTALSDTAGTGCTSDYAPTGGFNSLFWRRTTADDVSGVANTLNATASTSTAVQWVYAEIMPPGAAVAPPSALIVPLRGPFAGPNSPIAAWRGTDLPPVAPVAPAIPLAYVEPAIRARLAWLRRGRYLALPAPAVQPLPLIEPAIRVRPAWVRRGVFLARPPATQPPATSLTRAAARPAPRVRRGTFLFVPVPVVVVAPPQLPLPLLTRDRIWPGLVRRGRFLQLPPAATGRPPAVLRATTRAARPAARHGVFLPVPAALAPALRWITRANRLWATLRPSTRRLGASPVPTTAAAPAFTTGRRARLPLPRRGAYLPIPPLVVTGPTTGPVIPRVARTPVVWPRTLPRRGRFIPGLNPLVSPPGPQALPPAAIRGQHAASALRPRRGVFLPVMPVTVVAATPSPPARIRQTGSRVLQPRRRAGYLPLPPAASSWVPGWTAARRRPTGPSTFRRPRAGSPIPTAPVPTAYLQGRRRPPPGYRRGRFLFVPVLPPVPPPFFAQTVMRARLRWRWLVPVRRGRIVPPWMLGAFGVRARMSSGDHAVTLVSDASADRSTLTGGQSGARMTDGSTAAGSIADTQGSTTMTTRDGI